MAMNQMLTHESRGSRRFRFLAPMLAAVALAVASMTPSIILG